MADSDLSDLREFHFAQLRRFHKKPERYAEFVLFSRHLGMSTETRLPEKGGEKGIILSENELVGWARVVQVPYDSTIWKIWALPER